MENNKYLSDAIELAAKRAKYDHKVKKILADKNICAHILQGTVEEFKGWNIEDIKNCIQSDIQISKYSDSTLPDVITGLSSEAIEDDASSSFYDIRFSVIIPNKGLVKLFINIEAQQKYTLDTVPRSIVYASRMLSGQLGTEFSSKHYDDAKKVYSIWLCFNSPAKDADTITGYKLNPYNMYGDCKTHGYYDLLSVVLIRLSKDNVKQKSLSGGHRLINMLEVLFSHTLSTTEKKNLLTDEYKLDVKKDFFMEVDEMCNLSEGLIEQGIEKGAELKTINLVMKKHSKGISPEDIADDVDENITTINVIIEAIDSVEGEVTNEKVYAVLHS